MMDLAKYIEEEKKNIMLLAETLRKEPELGFFEFKSSETVKSFWNKLGLKVEGPFGRTGLVARIKGKKKGPTIALIGELDAVENKNGVSHACGHYIQTSQVFAAACALTKIKDQLCGDVLLVAVPAEEFLQVEKRAEMKKRGEIHCFSGKAEFIKLGLFDNVDMAAMIHAHPNTKDYRLFMEGSNLGFAAKNIRFIGKAVHGATPFEGRNALQSATLFLNGINANRETFRDEESIRIHPIITKGGTVVNIVPDDVRIETYVRGASKKAIRKGCDVVDRCAKAAAGMMGCKCEIENVPGYLPLMQDHNLSLVMEDVARNVLGDKAIGYNTPSVGSSDIGDLSSLIPVIQPTMGGFDGELHGVDFCVCDEWKSCLLGGQLLAGLALEVLKDDAVKAKQIIKNYKRLLTVKQYLEYLEN